MTDPVRHCGHCGESHAVLTDDSKIAMLSTRDGKFCVQCKTCKAQGPEADSPREAFHGWQRRHSGLESPYLIDGKGPTRKVIHKESGIQVGEAAYTWTTDAFAGSWELRLNGAHYFTASGFRALADQLDDQSYEKPWDNDKESTA